MFDKLDNQTYEELKEEVKTAISGFSTETQNRLKVEFIDKTESVFIGLI